MPLERIELGHEAAAAWQPLRAVFDGAQWTIGPSPEKNELCLIRSPRLRLEAGALYVFEFVLDSLDVDASMTSGRPNSAPMFVVALTDRSLDVTGTILFDDIASKRSFDVGRKTQGALVICPRRTNNYHLSLIFEPGDTPWPHRRRFRLGDFVTYRVADQTRADMTVETEMRHWGPLRRAVHRKCKTSRAFNAFVAAIEMRLGREELLSMPQYMSFCPTGQCNASCAFCSVTINRTGIIKRQIPFPKLHEMIGPVARTANVFGIEGNGEPTLYSHFDDLVQALIAHGAATYLITNAANLDESQIALATGLESINISLNACTAETHRRVMKMKNFDTVIANIQALTHRRGRRGQSPRVSVSFVVTRQNVAEAPRFLHFADDVLGVDRVLLRPLSELGNDLGTVEDLRDIVPYASDIADLVEGVGEYLETTAGRRRTEVVFEPGHFKAVKDDPLDVPITALGMEGRLLPPRCHDWSVVIGAPTLTWHSGADLHLSLETHAPGLIRAAPVPVAQTCAQRLDIQLRGRVDGLSLRLLGENGHVLDRLEPTGTYEDFAPFSLEATAGVITIEIEATTAVSCEIDFGQPRKPGPRALTRNQPLPRPARWEVCLREVTARWQGQTLHLNWQGAPGLYLIKSYSQPCLPGSRPRYPLRADVIRGRLGIGILDESFEHWIANFEFDLGHHDAAIEFDTGANHRFQVVLYAVGSEPLDATLDWQAAMLQQPGDGAGVDASPAATAAGPGNDAANDVLPLPASVEHESAPSVDVDPALDITASGAAATTDEPVLSPAAPSPTPAPANGDGGSSSHWLCGRTRFYCQKPWTDLNNFSVDGRMDVCCIATGPSQERYQLGNVFTQSFQEVWNGAVAREFRRTVNGEKPLPPCARCPMAFAYQGFWSDPDLGMWEVWKRVRLARLWRIPGFRTLHRWLFLALYTPFHLLAYRGIRRARALPDAGRLRTWYAA